ncbi:hypothetical protein ACGVWS_03980 [Enterobacteriaceae bacterium LUAb1]
MLNILKYNLMYIILPHDSNHGRVSCGEARSWLAARFARGAFSF